MARRTTLLLTRFRFDVVAARASHEYPLLAEECRILAFAGSPSSAEWLSEDVAETLLGAKPEANVTPDVARNTVERIIADFSYLATRLDEVARARAEELLETHRRVRTAAKQRGVRYRVEPHLPPDVIGVYVYLPAGV